MKWAPGKIAGALYILPVIALLPFWYIMFFVGNPTNPNYGEMFRLWFLEGPYRELFWYHAILPIVCAAMAVIHIRWSAAYGLSAKAQFLSGFALAASAWWLSNPGVAVFVSLPLMYSVRNAWHLTIRWSRP